MAADYRYEIKFAVTIGPNSWWAGFAGGYSDFRGRAFKKAHKFLDDPRNYEYDWVMIHDRKTFKTWYLTRDNPLC